MFTQAQVFNSLCVPLEDIIDWAIFLLSLGYDSPSLRILAGLTHLNDRLEVSYYVNQTLQELNLPKIEGKEAVIAYTSLLLQKFLVGKISQEKMLGDIYQLCLSWNYLEEIFDFYLLWNAVNDLKYDDMQYYWPDLTKENVNCIIKEQAQKWLDKYP
jgi:hypothetical protein